MDKIMIITGHNHYASGMMSALSMISGPKKNVVFFDFTESDTEESLREKFTSFLSQENEYLFVCDLLGGTPYKEAAKLSFNNPHIEVVTGANLGGMMDTALKLERLSLSELANNLVEASKKNLMLIRLEEEKTDGI